MIVPHHEPLVAEPAVADMQRLLLCIRRVETGFAQLRSRCERSVKYLLELKVGGRCIGRNEAQLRVGRPRRAVRDDHGWRGRRSLDRRHERFLVDDRDLGAHDVGTKVSCSNGRHDREHRDRHPGERALAVGLGLGGRLVDSTEIERPSSLRRAPARWGAAPARGLGRRGLHWLLGRAVPRAGLNFVFGPWYGEIQISITE